MVSSSSTSNMTGNPMFFLALFTSGVMLWWAMAAAVPIVLHLLSRRHRRTLKFAAVQFVLAAYQKSHRRFRFWQWLLLLLRVIAVLLLATALADPIINATASPDAQRRSRLWIFVVDSSMSMKTQEGQASRFSQALDRAATICADAANGDGFLVIQAATQPQWVIDSIALDPVAVRSTLKTLKPSDSTTSVARVVETVAQRIASIRRKALWTQPIHVVIFSDMQASSWRNVSSETSFPPEVSFQVVELGDASTANHYVRSLAIDPSLFVAGQPITLRTELKFDNTRKSDERLVQLQIDGVTVQSRRIEVDASGQGNADWDVSLAEGEHVVAVRLDDDALNADNVRRAVVNIRDRRRVACVAVDAAHLRFVTTALRSGTSGSMDVEEIVTTRLTSVQMETFDP
ncbi:MAG: BatA domain-containing protein [Pirellulaceae bacterium]